jgi:ATP-dependent Clp protease protease subunit
MRHRLIQLLADNRRAFTPVAKRIHRATDADEATIYLYDPIVDGRDVAEWWGGVCPQDLVPELRAIDAATIHLRIKCGGGDVFAAEAIAQAIRDSKSKVVAHIDGLAASAATTIACACREVVISPQSEYMIHEAWTLALGNKREFRRVAELLDQVDAAMIDDYARRTSQPRDRIAAWCEAETWFTAQQAIDYGFADRIADNRQTEPKEDEGAPQDSAPTWNLRAYLHREAPPTDKSPPPPTAAPAYASDDHRHRQQQRIKLALLLAPIA